jgi:hypothetical protein
MPALARAPRPRPASAPAWPGDQAGPAQELTGGMTAAGLRPERITPAVTIRPPHTASGTRSPPGPGPAVPG